MDVLSKELLKSIVYNDNRPYEFEPNDLTRILANLHTAADDIDRIIKIIEDVLQKNKKRRDDLGTD